ncbi:Hypothetical predicted protein [Octopus vulgaris]|uniref:Uncharacterized protein n=1 Tax=Octopus vulgaris TaxID=6645 RepID=A0AA36B298_OCTVU|nr:Hypothetical predicted protein [Octopus vulgaris]
MSAAAQETIGFARKKDQDWFGENDETIYRLIADKLRTRLDLDNHATVENKRKNQQASAECQRGIRAQNSWWQMKAEETQNYADQRDFEFFTHGDPELRNHLILLIHKIWESKASPPPTKDFRDATIITIYKKTDLEDCKNYWASHS